MALLLLLVRLLFMLVDIDDDDDVVVLVCDLLFVCVVEETTNDWVRRGEKMVDQNVIPMMTKTEPAKLNLLIHHQQQKLCWIGCCCSCFC